jgi:hypothetical protein
MVAQAGTERKEGLRKGAHNKKHIVIKRVMKGTGVCESTGTGFKPAAPGRWLR